MIIPNALSVLQNLPPTFWETGVAAIIIPVVIQKFKGFLEHEQEKQPWIYVLISTTLSFLAALGQYVDAGGGASWTVLGEHTATVLGAITLIYHLPKVGVKALSQTAQDAKLGKALKASTSSSTTSAVAATVVTTTSTVPANVQVLENEFGQ